MTEERLFCQFCGSQIQPGFKFCDKCGSPVDAGSAASAATAPAEPAAVVGSSSPSPAPANFNTSQNKPTGKKPAWIIPLIGIGCLIMLCIAAFVVGGILMYSSNGQAEISTVEAQAEESDPVVSEEPEIEDEQPEIPTDTPISLPDSTSTTAATEVEPLPTQTEKPVVMEEVPVATKDILLDYSDQWQVEDTDQYRTDISQRGDWAIGVKQADMSVAVISPGQAAAGVENVLITMDVATSAADQIAGVRCQVQDEKNYYQVSFKNKQFAIGRVVDGQLTPLTEPYWKDSQFIGTEGLPGGTNVTVTCQGSSIGVSIEGMGEIPLVSDPDDRFQQGKIALFAAPAEKMTDEFFSFAIFNNLTIETLP
jgi:cytoskeletal protein RodZ